MLPSDWKTKNAGKIAPVNPESLNFLRTTKRKKCASCKKRRLITKFTPDRRRPSGLYSSCRECSAKACTKFRRLNPERSREQVRAWRKRNPEHVKELDRSYRLKNGKKRKTWMATWRKNNLDHVISYSKRYIHLNREKLSRYVRDKSRSDVQYRMCRQLRTRLADIVRLQGKRRAGSAIKNLGCSASELRKYIESLWQIGMSWENWGRGPGKWQIDHKEPLSGFNLSDGVQLLKACHFRNLQPLWHEEHVKKTVLEVKACRSRKHVSPRSSFGRATVS